MKKPIWLIGFRGAGKTTIGRQLAQELRWPFLDVDEEWEKRNGSSILDFVATHGIEKFRVEEEALMREFAVSGELRVIAAGGGFVDWEPSRKILEICGALKVYLEAPANTLWNRLKDSEYRRKINNLTTLEALTELLEKRRPFYEKIATIRLECQDISECLAALKSNLEK